MRGTTLTTQILRWSPNKSPTATSLRSTGMTLKRRHGPLSYQPKITYMTLYWSRNVNITNTDCLAMYCVYQLIDGRTMRSTRSQIHKLLERSCLDRMDGVPSKTFKYMIFMHLRVPQQGHSRKIQNQSMIRHHKKPKLRSLQARPYPESPEMGS